MSYDWEKIFQGKTNEELLEIINGKTLMREDVIPLAKKELENRNFDFDNIEANKKAWLLSDLMEADAEDRPPMIFGRYFIPYKYFLMIFIAILLISFSLYEFLNTDPNLIISIFVFLLVLIFPPLLINNSKYSNWKKNKKLRAEEIEKLSEELGKQNLLDKNGAVVKDLILRQKKSKDDKRTLIYIGIGAVVFYVIIKVFLTFL
jgi:hypothetical protein